MRAWVMARHILAPAMCAASIFVAAPAGAAPCIAEVVPGQTIEEVAKVCASPTLTEHRDLWQEVTEGKRTTRRTSTYDEWTYDTSSLELMLNLIFDDGKLTEIRSLGYGSPRDPMMPQCRNGEALAVGDSMVDAYLKCGEPLAKEKRPEKIAESVEGEIRRRSSIAVVEWTYRYGPDAPGYTVRFENGQAMEIRPREFGK